jgi:hypothetical protein
MKNLSRLLSIAAVLILAAPAQADELPPFPEEGVWTEGYSPDPDERRWHSDSGWFLREREHPVDPDTRYIEGDNPWTGERVSCVVQEHPITGRVYVTCEED